MRNHKPVEAMVKSVVDDWVTGRFELEEGDLLSATRLARLASEKFETTIHPSSVYQVLERWERIGYCTVTQSPLAFELYTPDAVSLGLRELKKRDKAARAKANA